MFHHYDYLPPGTCTPFATRLSAALRSLFVDFVVLYYMVEIPSNHKYNGRHIYLPFTQMMAIVAWRLKSNWGSCPQSLGAFGNCRAIILWPLASVCLASLVWNLEHVNKMKRQVKRHFFTVKTWDVTKQYTRTWADTLLRRPSGKGTWDSYRILVGRK